jgi:hypothetical protein
MYLPKTHDKVPAYGFNAQGEAILDPSQTMTYKSHKMLEKESDKYKHLKKTSMNIDYMPANVQAENESNTTFSQLDECFKTTNPLAMASQQRHNPVTNPGMSHNQIVSGFEQASMNIESIDQMQSQSNPLASTLPVRQEYNTFAQSGCPKCSDTKNQSMMNNGTNLRHCLICKISYKPGNKQKDLKCPSCSAPIQMFVLSVDKKYIKCRQCGRVGGNPFLK